MRILTTTYLRRPIEEVFDFLTTPANWPRWHPSSLKVMGAVDHSLEVGEQCTEQFRVAGENGTAVWTVRERQAPRRWVIEGVGENGNEAVITYALKAQGGGTTFERELVFTKIEADLSQTALAAFHRLIEAESTEALRRLKAVLEQGLPPEI
jgi:uncharacterized protein YndB with AHSA1/START domain